MKVIDTIQTNLEQRNYFMEAIAYSNHTKSGVVLAIANMAHSPNREAEYVVWWFDDHGATFSGTYCNHSAARKEFSQRVQKI